MLSKLGLLHRTERLLRVVSGQRGAAALEALRCSPLARRLARGAFWSFIGAAIARTLALVASILVARALPREGYGALGAIQNTIGFFGTVAGFGLGTAATKYVAEFRNSNPIRAEQIIAFSSLVAVVTGGVASLALFLASDWLALKALAAPGLAPELRIGSFLLFFGALNGLQTGVLNGLEAFPALAAISLWSGLAAAPLQILGARWGGLRGAVWALLATAILGVVLSQIAIGKAMRSNSLRWTASGCWSVARVVAGFGSSLVVTGLVVAAANWVATTFLVHQQTGYAEMATLNAANNWFGIVVFFAATIQQGIFPALSETIGKGTRAATMKIARSSLLLALVVATPLAIVGIVASPLLMGLYGHGFAQAWPVMAITVACAWVYCFHMFLNQILLALNRPTSYFATHFAWATTYIALLIARIRNGAEGLVLARLGSYVLLVGLTASLLLPILRFPPEERDAH